MTPTSLMNKVLISFSKEEVWSDTNVVAPWMYRTLQLCCLSRTALPEGKPTKDEMALMVDSLPQCVEVALFYAALISLLPFC